MGGSEGPTLTGVGGGASVFLSIGLGGVGCLLVGEGGGGGNTGGGGATPRPKSYG